MKSNKGNNDVLCKFCEKNGHTEDRCWQNIDNPDNQLPAKLKEEYAALKFGGGGSGARNPEGKKESKLLVQLLQKLYIRRKNIFLMRTVVPPCIVFTPLTPFFTGSLNACPDVTKFLANK